MAAIMAPVMTVPYHDMGHILGRATSAAIEQLRHFLADAECYSQVDRDAI